MNRTHKYIIDWAVYLVEYISIKLDTMLAEKDYVKRSEILADVTIAQCKLDALENVIYHVPYVEHEYKKLLKEKTGSYSKRIPDMGAAKYDINQAFRVWGEMEQKKHDELFGKAEEA